MIFNAFIIALVIAFVMTMIFVWGFGLRGAWSNGLAFFAITFLASWAAGIWVRPVGAALPQSTPWIPQTVVGFLSALLMSSSAPAWRRNTQSDLGTRPERRNPPVPILTPAYWVALVVLVIAVVSI